jgi:hypothetical protein
VSELEFEVPARVVGDHASSGRTAAEPRRALELSPAPVPALSAISIATTLTATYFASLAALGIDRVLEEPRIAFLAVLLAFFTACYARCFIRHHARLSRYYGWWIAFVFVKCWFVAITQSGKLAIIPLELLFLVPAYREGVRSQQRFGEEGAGGDYRRARISYFEFVNGDFTHADFTDAELKHVVFTNCKLSEAVFAQARVSDCEFRGCEMPRANLRGSIWQKCFLLGMDLTGADLGQSRWIYSHLGGANLESADLRGTVFHQSLLAGARVAAASYDASTQWTKDINPVSGGASFERSSP